MYESWATLIAVPAHTGGVDLRYVFIAHAVILHRPRPHGRGGFKVVVVIDIVLRITRPRPHGRGGFKVNYFEQMGPEGASPPTRAGWI